MASRLALYTKVLSCSPGAPSQSQVLPLPLTLTLITAISTVLHQSNSAPQPAPIPIHRSCPTLWTLSSQFHPATLRSPSAIPFSRRPIRVSRSSPLARCHPQCVSLRPLRMYFFETLIALKRPRRRLNFISADISNRPSQPSPTPLAPRSVRLLPHLPLVSPPSSATLLSSAHFGQLHLPHIHHSAA